MAAYLACGDYPVSVPECDSAGWMDIALGVSCFCCSGAMKPHGGKIAVVPVASATR